MRSLILPIVFYSSIALAAEFTYDGPLNPEDFQNWITVQIGPCYKGKDHYHVVIQNPDKTAEIQIVALTLFPSNGGIMTITAYEYDLNGTHYVFMINGDNHYAQIHPPKPAEYNL